MAGSRAYFGRAAGEGDGEGGVLAGNGRCLDGALVGFDGSFDDGEPEASAFDFTLMMMLFDAVEAFEDEGKIGAGDAYSVVGDPEDNVAFLVAAGADLEFKRFGGVLFECVFNEIEEDLIPVKAITNQSKVFISDFEADLGLLLVDNGFQPLDDILHAVKKAKGSEIERGLFAGF